MKRSIEIVQFEMVTQIMPSNRLTCCTFTELFQNVLQDALEWAMKNSLWGHALFLASKMDSRAHANVMTR